MTLRSFGQWVEIEMGRRPCFLLWGGEIQSHGSVSLKDEQNIIELKTR